MYMFSGVPIGLAVSCPFAMKAQSLRRMSDCNVLRKAGGGQYYGLK
jgi:hypothetical protein